MIALAHRFRGAGDDYYQLLNFRGFLLQVIGGAGAGLGKLGLKHLPRFRHVLGGGLIPQAFGETGKALRKFGAQARAGLIAERTGGGYGGAVGIQSGLQQAAMVHFKVSLQSDQYLVLSTEEDQTSVIFFRENGQPWPRYINQLRPKMAATKHPKQ